MAFFYSNYSFTDVCRHIPHLLESDGSFNEIKQEECDIPLGSWNGKFGELVNNNHFLIKIHFNTKGNLNFFFFFYRP